MTAKEKAKELVDKFYITNDYVDMYFAKQRALICVQEIIKSMPIGLGGKDYPKAISNSLDYWLQVKQEIELL